MTRSTITTVATTTTATTTATTAATTTTTTTTAAITTAATTATTTTFTATTAATTTTFTATTIIIFAIRSTSQRSENPPSIPTTVFGAILSYTHVAGAGGVRRLLHTGGVQSQCHAVHDTGSGLFHYAHCDWPDRGAGRTLSHTAAPIQLHLSQR